MLKLTWKIRAYTGPIGILSVKVINAKIIQFFRLMKGGRKKNREF